MRVFSIKPLVFYSLSIIILASSCSSQAKLAYKAKQTYERGEYAKAIELYERLLENEKVKTKEAEYSFYLGDCYRRINDSKKAERYFSRAVKKKYDDPYARLLLADQMLKNGSVDEAEIAYSEYREKSKDKDNKRVEYGLQSCALAKNFVNSPTRYKVENLKIFNTRENEFCPAYSRDDFSQIYFTSSQVKDSKDGKEKEKDSKLGGSKRSEVSGMNFTDIMESRADKLGAWSKPSVLEDTTINTLFDDGAPTFNADRSVMYYTYCPKEKGKQYGCQIYQSQRRGMEWGVPKRVPIVPDSVSVGHPSLSKDGLSLYFAARMKGGMGGADIWVCERKSANSEWGTPRNLGSEINTPGDELYPFIRDDGNLYFSSDYWPGMGGLDIFRAIRSENGNWKINNMGYPINSPQDDFGIVFQGNREIGLFTSARKEGKGGDDIYSFELPELKFLVEGKITEKGSRNVIADAPIQLIGSDGSFFETKTKNDGSYHLQLKQYTDYIVLGAADGYLKKKTKVSTNNLTNDTTFVVDFELITMSKPVEIPNIFYDFGKWTLNEASQEALLELAALLEDNPNITIELGAHTDMVGDSLSNMVLSQKRAQSVIDYLNGKGYDLDRLVAKGYGENVPVVADEVLVAEISGLSVGDTLTSEFILKFEDKDVQEKLNQVNRRTELKILSSNYIPKPEHFMRFRNKRLKMEN